MIWFVLRPLHYLSYSIDNSEWMRNSDFSPSRIESQQDAVNLICGAKTRQNVENVVGLITTAGRQ